MGIELESVMVQSPFPLHVPEADYSSLVRIVIHFSATILLIHVHDVVTVYICCKHYIQHLLELLKTSISIFLGILIKMGVVFVVCVICKSKACYQACAPLTH